MTMALTLTCIAATGCSGGLPNEASDPTQSIAGEVGVPASFRFRELVPGETSVQAALKAGTVRDCVATPAEAQTRCAFAESRVGNVPAGYGRVIFKENRFDWFNLRPGASEFEALRSVLGEAYGKPCSTRSRALQNSYGAQFAGDEVSWCFKEGRLTLRRHAAGDDGARRGDLEFFRTGDNLTTASTESLSADTL
ncbi:hypothetical protein I5E68_09635 [Novosphingobium sp. YJ-S2-02]|uniref:Uncharacterized protein n=1 Tax=Novosphingobium aureum TaxID=2792964 RepID=A0A931HC27_9SPHN|nr:hypothetical protein [Novosphingobium aureum]MBH0113206.1 hypothetical protein [Novosphingobium aureum]